MTGLPQCGAPQEASDLAVCADAMLAASHRRSLAYGLDPRDAPDHQRTMRADLAMLIEDSRALHRHARPVMETLYGQIVNTHNMVLLTDAQGRILDALGDADFLEKADRVALSPGMNWSEQGKGTNAIGTAIAEGKPTLVHANQHYLRANHFLTCSAAPIFSHQGKVVGVLDVSGDQRSFHRHTMALVRMSAQMIENQLFASAHEDAVLLRFHGRPEFIGTLMEGLLSFAPDGRFMAVSRSGAFQLGLSPAMLAAHTFSSLFGLPASALADFRRATSPALMELRLCNGMRLHARAEWPPARVVMPAAVTAPAAPARRARCLDELNTGDPQMARLIGKVEKIIGHDIGLLITGETGTGKEWLAQALHQTSARANKPFVAVNCAAIPEMLIESELFGYEEGAFTGASKRGASGRIQQANGGTLFLDEIGDMPLALQARLLRVLQERSVTPLGGTKSVAVDLRLICATHRNLRERIAAGAFREDLYYRLNGLAVRLPPLRERTDLDALVARMLAAETGGPPCSVSPEVMAMFRRHPWPGNLRQLHSLLRTACVMADADREIRREHLPEDFFDELHEAGTAPADDGEAIATRLDAAEMACIRKTLEAHGGNVAAAARALGISRTTIYRKLAR